MDFFRELEQRRERWTVLTHPFYLRWSEGDLTPGELAIYAGEYRHAVVALADAMHAAGRAAEASDRAQIEQHAAEESSHVDLWDAFARAAGADLAREPSPETSRCVDSWTAGADALERLVVTYAIESGQPDISATKLEGLLGHYGYDEGPATEYFELHAELDRRHAAESRALIEDRLEGADQQHLLDLAEAALRGNWELLDGVLVAGQRLQ